MSIVDIISAVGFWLLAIALVVNDIRWRRWKRESDALWKVRRCLNAVYDKQISPRLDRVRDLSDEEHAKLVRDVQNHNDMDAELRRKQREHNARMPLP